MYHIIKVLKTKNKEIVEFDNKEALKGFMQKEFGEYVLQKPYIRSNFIITQVEKKGDYRVKETYSNGMMVSPSDELFNYLKLK